MTHAGSASPRPNKVSSPALVLAGGLVTTALALAAVWWVTNTWPDVNVMGWYLWWVVPAGAMAVGAGASSGYALVSWLGGVKISGRLLFTIFALQVPAYLGACWIEYVGYAPTYDDGTAVDFWTWFDWATRSIAFLDKEGNPGEPFGAWGYAFRALEIAGFSLGSLAGPAALRAKPYCEACSLYMRSREVAVFAASVPAVKVGKKDIAGKIGHENEQRAAWERGLALLDELESFAEANDPGRFRDRLKELEPQRKAAAKLPVRIQVELSHCPRCEAGLLRARRASGQGEHVQVEDLVRSELPQYFVRNATS